MLETVYKEQIGAMDVLMKKGVCIMIKLVATDMDGTLLNDKKEKPADFETWVLAHPEILTVIASGRQYYALERDFIPIKDHLIFVAENGGLVFHKGKIIYSNEMEKDDVYDCLDRLEKIPGAQTILCGAESAYVAAPDDDTYNNVIMYYERMTVCKDMDEMRSCVEKDRIIKIALYFKANDADAKRVYFKDFRKNLSVALSGDAYIDIANASVNKGIAIEAIQKQFGIDRSESMAFGDFLNDCELLKSCEESYCMENGHPELKQIAKHIAESNEKNGVMKVLYTLG